MIPNSVFKVKGERRKVFVGDQIDECKDYSGLFYVLPFQKVIVDHFVIGVEKHKLDTEVRFGHLDIYLGYCEFASFGMVWGLLTHG